MHSSVDERYGVRILIREVLAFGKSATGNTEHCIEKMAHPSSSVEASSLRTRMESQSTKEMCQGEGSLNLNWSR